MAPKTKKAAAELRAFALSLPGAAEHFPWGERVAKVGKKIFVFLGRGEDASASPKKSSHSGEPGGLMVAVKLAPSHEEALLLPFTTPTTYGLGKAGWITATFGRGEDIPVALLKEWIEESYREIAPKAQIAKLQAKSAPLPKRRKP